MPYNNLSYYHLELQINKENIVLREPTVKDARAYVDYIDKLIQEDTFISSKHQPKKMKKDILLQY